MHATQSALGLVDGFWYWVRYDVGFGLEPIEAPARYQANVDCFYSWEFSGIPARELVVLGPALRAQPADLTPDALLRRIQASPFRDDKALADLVQRLIARVSELEAQTSASTTGNTTP